MQEKQDVSLQEQELQRQFHYMDLLKERLTEEAARLGRPYRYAVVTLGCQMNAHDSEKLIGILAQAGAQASGEDEADLVIYNTCCVRENAEQRVLGRLGYLKGQKAKRPGMKIALCGCMMQEPHMVEKIRRSYPQVDLIFGTFNIYRFAELFYTLLEQGGMIVDIWKENGKIVEDLPSLRRQSFRASVNIMYGCNNFCTYCIVPYVRGRERSRTPEHILEEVRRRVAEGAVEIQLLGQNVNSYGRGLDEPIRFDELLEQVNAVPGVERIRFMTSHPKDLSPELIAAMGRLDKVCPHFHLPLQSGSSRILKAMNRHYDAERYRTIVRQLRDTVSGIAVTTDIIVGFPGETEEDFEETLQMVRDVRFNGAFTFLYSPREGTPAASMPDPVPEAVAKARFERLLKLLEEIQYEDQQKLVGQTLTVLAEEHSKNDPTMLTGRAPGNQLVHFPAGDIRIGQMAEVTITQASAFYLTGRLTGGPM